MNRATRARRRPKLILAVLALSLLSTLAGPATPASAATCGFSVQWDGPDPFAFWKNCTTVNQKVKVDKNNWPDSHPCIRPGVTRWLGPHGSGRGQVRHASLEGGC